MAFKVSGGMSGMEGMGGVGTGMRVGYGAAAAGAGAVEKRLDKMNYNEQMQVIVQN